MARARKFQQTDVTDEAATLRHRNNVKDFYRAMTVLVLIVIGYFEFAPEENAAPQVKIASAKT